jgi:hypothetical protein
MELNFTMVTWPVPIVILLGIVIFFGGAFLGYFNMNVDAKKKIEAAETKAEVLRSEAQRKLADAETLKAQAPKTIDDPGLLRLKNKDGTPSLEMDGVLLTTKNTTPDQKKRLIELLSVIRPWLEGGQPISAVSPQPQTMTSMPAAAAQPAPVQSAISTTSSLSATQPLPVTNLSEREFKALSIIAQIDHVFQTRIVGTPYEEMGIRIFEGSVGSVEVKIGANRYASIDDVPDADIKNMIRAAIAEWEKKYTPGQ